MGVTKFSVIIDGDVLARDMELDTALLGTNCSHYASLRKNTKDRKAI